MNAPPDKVAPPCALRLLRASVGPALVRLRVDRVLWSSAGSRAHLGLRCRGRRRLRGVRLSCLPGRRRRRSCAASRPTHHSHPTRSSRGATSIRRSPPSWQCRSRAPRPSGRTDRHGSAVTACALAVPYVVGVRDWRCYGVLLLWPPVISAIQTGSVTLAIAARRGARLAVPRPRARGRAPQSVSPSPAKLFLWPLVVWLVATRRVRHAVAATGIGVVLLLASWAVIGFAGLVDYPSLLRRLEDAVGAGLVHGATSSSSTLGLPGSGRPRGLAGASGSPALAGVVARGSPRGRAGRLPRRDRGVARAHSDRVAPLLRAAPRRRRARAAAARGSSGSSRSAWSSRPAAGIRSLADRMDARRRRRNVALALRVVLRDDREHHVVRAPAPA